MSSNGYNAFNQTITLDECLAASVLGGTCYLGGTYYFVRSNCMTVETCIQICITNYGYKYAGLIAKYFIKIFQY